MVTVIFEVSKRAIAYTMQRRGIRDFGVDRTGWNRMFKGIYDEDRLLIDEIEKGLEEKCAEAERLREIIEKRWRQREKDVVSWLRELTKVNFKEPVVRVCVVPFASGQTPFRDVPLMIVGRIRKGWGYPETIGHELAHILFNQNFSFESGVEHPYVQLIEEEIAVRLGVRSKYFDYEVPAFAGWVHEAKKREMAWREYLQHIEDYRDIGQFIRENEKLKGR